MAERLCILAGDGQLVVEALEAGAERGWIVHPICLTSRDDLADWDPVLGTVSQPLALLFKLRHFKPTLICMVGALTVSDSDRDGLFKFLLPSRKTGNKTGPKSRGDTKLSGLVGVLEFLTGAKVMGVHELVSDLKADSGLIAGPKLTKAKLAHCQFALDTAREIGRLDLGQAVVCAGGRVIAAEDIAGTAALIGRVQSYVTDGLTGNGRDALVLAKARKPDQPDSVDLPAIGPDTVVQAAAAQISAIVVQTGQCLLIDRSQLCAKADALGVSVIGLAPSRAQS